MFFFFNSLYRERESIFVWENEWVMKKNPFDIWVLLKSKKIGNVYDIIINNKTFDPFCLPWNSLNIFYFRNFLFLIFVINEIVYTLIFTRFYFIFWKRAMWQKKNISKVESFAFRFSLLLFVCVCLCVCLTLFCSYYLIFMVVFFRSDIKNIKFKF